MKLFHGTLLYTTLTLIIQWKQYSIQHFKIVTLELLSDN